MARKRLPSFNPQTFLSKVGSGKTNLTPHKKQVLYSQGDAADAVFYIQGGRVKLTVVSQQGREAVVAILERGSFLGESCLAGQTVRTATATALEDSSIVRIDKGAMIRVLHEEPTFAELFMSYLLAHSIRIQAAGADPPADGPLWERRQAGAGDREGQSGNARRDDRDHTVTGQFLHE